MINEVKTKGSTAISTERKNENSVEEFGYTQELRRTLSTWDLFVYGLCLMVPIAPFAIYGVVAQASSGMVSLTYLIGMLGMLFTALSYARMSEAFPIAGSVYSYAQQGINEYIGFLAGWIFLLDYVLVPTLIYLVAASALKSVLPEVPILTWLFFFIALNTFLNLAGVQITTKALKWVLALTITVVFIFIVCSFIAVLNGVNGAEFSFNPIFDPNYFSMKLVMGAVSIAVLSFVGFDAVSTLAEESKEKSTAVGRAIILSLLAIGVLFIIQTWLASLLISDFNSFENIDTAAYEVAEVAGGPFLKWATAITVAIAFGVADATIFQAAISRLLFSMGRDEKIPGFFAKVHPKYKTPYTSIIIVAILTFIISSLFSPYLDNLSEIVNFGALTGFILLHVSVINYFIRRKKSTDYLNHLIFPIIGMAIMGYVWLSLAMLAKIVGGAWLLIGIIYTIYLKSKRGFFAE